MESNSTNPFIEYKVRKEPIAMRKVVIIQARMGSSRLPGKVLMEIEGRPVLKWMASAAQSINMIDQIIIATSIESQDDAIEVWCKENNVNIFRGHEKDVLSRYYGAAKEFGLKSGDIVMRLTADCPILDPQVCGEVLALQMRTGKDYVNNVSTPRSWPDGLDCEVFTFNVLEKTFQEATDDLYREHVTLYIRRNPHLFDTLSLSCPVGGIGTYRWTLDTEHDLKHIKYLMSKLAKSNSSFSYLDICKVEQEGHAQKIGVKSQFEQSFSHLERALAIIPGASQTFSKSYVHHIKGVSPFFIERGKGAYTWDMDGNKYIDYLSALLPVLLGYCDDDVDEAIKAQLAKGISFSLATDLEAELGEMLVNMIPSAEMVRFSKNGSDVTSGAIRLARAYTGRTQIAVCGYHGWHDWYIGTTPSGLGVPSETKKLTDQFTFNNIDSLKNLLSEKKYAAIILEAEATEKSENGFLEEVRTLATQTGTVLIYDEIVTGFRSSLGGIQELSGVEPDLSCFGKAMGNGMPISALVGKREFMQALDTVFFSGTYGGETLSIAAAIACLNKYKLIDGVTTINKLGKGLQRGVNEILKAEGINHILKIQGGSWWPAMVVNHTESSIVKMLIRQELARNGIIQGSGFNLSVAHSNNGVLEQTFEAWHKVSMKLRDYLEHKNIKQFLQSNEVEPFFQVRQ